MANWNVVQLERLSADGYVFTAHWRASDGLASAYGSISLERPDELIPYEQLTEALCLQWVKDRLDVEQIEADLEKQKAEIAAPSSATGLPW
jgi:hypothetical protein